MTNEKMEQRLASALEKTAPDDMSGVLSRCEARKGTVIPMTTKKTVNRKWTTLVAACLAVMLLCGGGVFYQQAHAVASVVSLDVNPSIELKVSKSEKVLVCKTPSTVLVSSRWSFSARVVSLSSTEIMMAEEMLSR